MKIGVIIGKGTGKILSMIFKTFLEYYAPLFDVEVIFEENTKPFDTFWSLKENDDAEFVKKKNAEDADELWKLLLDFKEKDIQTIFRTGINAESLYLLRQRAKAVKEINFKTRHNKCEILVIRDEMQGFYANRDYQIGKNEEEVSGSFHFTQKNFEQIFQYANERGKEVFEEQAHEKWAVYKYHILSNALDKWVNEINGKIEHPFHIYQPDTGLSKMYDFLNQSKESERLKKLLLIVSNEVGDIIYESLLETLSFGDKNELYTRNIYLHPDLNKPLLYQTVHGSADDLIVKGKLNELNPYATLRITAAIIANNFQNEEDSDSIPIVRLMEYAIYHAKSKGFFSGRAKQQKDIAATLLIITEELNKHLLDYNKKINPNKKEINKLINHIQSSY